MKLSSNYPRTDVYFIFYKSILRNKKFLYHKLSTKDINLSILFFPFIKLHTKFNRLFFIKRKRKHSFFNIIFSQ